MAMIETVNLTKKYGDLTALDNLNLSIEAGECFGFIARHFFKRAGEDHGLAGKGAIGAATFLYRQGCDFSGKIIQRGKVARLGEEFHEFFCNRRPDTLDGAQFLPRL